MKFGGLKCALFSAEPIQWLVPLPVDVILGIRRNHAGIHVRQVGVLILHATKWTRQLQAEMIDLLFLLDYLERAGFFGQGAHVVAIVIIIGEVRLSELALSWFWFLVPTHLRTMSLLGEHPGQMRVTSIGEARNSFGKLRLLVI